MTPIEAFEKGWNVYALGLVMPAGIVSPESGKTITWEAILERDNFSEEEAYTFGQRKGHEYFNAVTGTKK